jgi:predicted transcriptional regulator
LNIITRISIKLGIIALLLLLSSSKTSNISATVENNQHDYITNQNDIEITSQYVIIDFRGLDVIHVKEEIEFKNLQNTSITELDFWPSVNLNFENINAVDAAYDPISLVQNEYEDYVTLYFDSDIGTNQSYWIRVDYYLDISLDPNGKKHPYHYYFQYSPVLKYFTHEYKLDIGLPKNSWLYEDDIIQTSFFPTNGSYDPSGSRIFLYWNFNNIQPDSEFLIYIWFQPIDTKIPVWLYILGLLLGPFLGAVSVYWWMKRKETKVIQEIGKIFLTEDQKTLLRLIIEADGKVTQKQLIEKTGFSKSKISRNLTPLRHNELITKERWGREYKVFITDKGRKVIE